MKQLSEFLNWVNGMNEVQMVYEDLTKAHLTHPEDLVLMMGSAGVGEAINRMKTTIARPHEVTVKWDGSPALIFGYGTDGKFRIMDKHMFDKVDDSGRNVFTPDQFAQYDENRGVNRGDLVQTIRNLYPSLKAACGKDIGYYWCDVLFGQHLTPVNGFYVFQPNPTGIEYRVEADSDLGKSMFANKIAGIAVHQYIPANALELAKNATDQAREKGLRTVYKPTQFAQSLNGTLGKLRNPADSRVAIVPSKMPVTPEFDTRDLDTAFSTVEKNAASVATSIDNFVSGIPGANKTTNDAFKMWLTSYVNYEVRKLGLDNNVQKQKVAQLLKVIGRDFPEYIKLQLPKIKNTESQKLVWNHLVENQKGMMDTYSIWAALYKLKMMMYDQLDVISKSMPVKGYIGANKDIESQEGYVAHDLKYVDRLGGFSAQHLSARQSMNEDESTGKTIVIMPGGFHPFHAGHYALYKSAVEAFPNAEVYVAATNAQAERPFPFSIKEKLAKVAGVKSGHFIQVKSPFQPREITDKFNPQEDVLIFVRSEKDKNESPKPGGVKKDGSPAYFQPYPSKDLVSFGKHAYIAYLPTVKFGPGITSATEIRKAWPTLDDRRKTAMVMSLYPAAQKNPKLAQNIVQMMDIGMNSELTEADNPNYFGGSSQSAIPGTPQDLMPQPDMEEIIQHQKEMAEIQRFLRHRPKNH